jgi:hypothetical protein
MEHSTIFKQLTALLQGGQDFLDMTVNFDFGKSFPHTAILPNYESAAFDAHELPAIQGFLFVDPK